MDKVSVVVPVYKDVFLRRCVESIINQTYSDLQIILVNDESPDSSPEIINEYAKKDQRITIINKKNGGVASARNCGIEYALENNPNGYITFVDDDDYLVADGIETLIENIKKYNVEVAWAEFNVIDAKSGKNIGEEFDGKVELMDANQILMNEKWRTSYSLVWGKLFKVKLWKNIRLPDWCRAYDDGATTFKILYNTKKIIRIHKSTLNYFLSVEGITRNSVDENRCEEALFTQTEKIDFYKEKGEKALLKMAYVGYLNDILDNMVYSQKFEKNSEEYFDKMKKLYRKNMKYVVSSNISFYQKIRYALYYLFPSIVVKRNK